MLPKNLVKLFRPGGVYGQGRPPINPGYGEGGIYPGGNRPDAGILTGPIPSWVKEGPFREFDHCKCSERFNCQSPGISYVSIKSIYLFRY